MNTIIHNYSGYKKVYNNLNSRVNSYKEFLIRIMNLSLVTIGFALLSPLFLITALAIYINNPGPVFYYQNRVGKNGKLFKCFKFRSMVVNADEIKKELTEKNESGDGVIFKMKHDPRITAVGRIIRRLSIDELPQLYNILTGDMSIVGPRPAIPEEVSEYTPYQQQRLAVTPGLTCLWQISGRSNLPFKKQVELDIKYIKNRGLLYDLAIILKTIPAVLSGKGAY